MSTPLERTADPDTARATLRACLGAVHRLAWSGEDPAGDRRRALTWVRTAVTTLSRTHRPLAAVVDWWLVAALGEDPVERAYSVDREIPGALGETLRHLLDEDAPRKLDVVRRPARLHDVLRQLERLCERNPGKIAPEKQVLADAIGECRQVLRAADEGASPPRGLRLVGATDAALEAWAGEGPSAGRRVTPGTPVFTALVHHLAQRRDLVEQAYALWPRTDRPAPELPADWRKVLTDSCGEDADIACALVEDALPEPGPRPLLDPAPRARPPGEEDQVFWFVLARETGDLPDWAEPLARRLDALTGQLDALQGTYDGDAAEALAVAREAVARIDPEEAAEWLEQAAEMHREATQGADLERVRERAEARVAQLERLGREVPGIGSDVETWAERVDARWREARDELRGQVAAIGARVDTLRGPTGPVRHATHLADDALNRQDLLTAATALERAREALAPLLAAEATRLGPELSAIARRTSDPGIAAGIERAVARRALGLDTESLVRELEALLDHREAAAALVREGVRVAWVLGGVPSAGPAGGGGVGVRGVTVTQGHPNDAPDRVARWGEIDVRPPSDALGRVYLRVVGALEGPYRVVSGDLVPEDATQAVASLGQADFERLFGRIEVGDDRWLVPHPPSLEELLLAGGQAVDRLDDEAAAAWLATELDGAPSADALRRWLAAHDAVPEALRAARLARLTDLLARAEALEPVRAEAVAEWLATDDGRAAIDRAAADWVDRASDELSRRLAERTAELEAAEQQRVEARERTHAEIAALRDEVVAVEELLNDRKLQLLAKLGGGVAPAAPVAPTAPAPPTALAAPLRARPFTPSAVPDLPRLIRDVAGATWGEVEVANLLLSMGTGRWTLLAGLPGVGKSTFVRSVLSRLGHGPDTDRYLELVVRRDWQDDAALFGFWHPTLGTWTPSSDGFVEHLLRALDGTGSDGLWPILVEELNLASPEYYLARALSAFEAATPTVRLYDPELAPANVLRYPPAFDVSPAVRVVATVNVDDTVERLSPRFLSRASVIWIEPTADAPVWRPEDDVTSLRVPFSALVSHEEADLGPITEVVRFLQDQRVPGGPTARTQRAMARYLAAARGVLPAPIAQDLQVLQRVLPPLRGVGPRWRRLLEQLADLLARRGWERSAARTRELRERGEELGDWYDFFHT